MKKVTLKNITKEQIITALVDCKGYSEDELIEDKAELLDLVVDTDELLAYLN